MANLFQVIAILFSIHLKGFLVSTDKRLEHLIEEPALLLLVGITILIFSILLI